MGKEILFTMIFLVIATSIVSAAGEQAYLEATIMKYEPQPAQPGKYVKVYIKLENNGTANAKNVALEVNPEYPFSLDPGKSNRKEVGLLGPKSVYVAEFSLRVDEKAVEGTNKLKVRYNIDEKQQSWAEQQLDISVQTDNPVLSIDSITIEPQQIIPGSTGTIKLRVKNLADTFLSDINVNIDLSSSTLLFAPMNSPSEKNLYQLNSQATYEFDFEIIAYPNTPAGIYKIPVEITYSNNVGTKYTKSDIIGVIVNSEPDIKVVVDSTTLVQEQRVGNIVLKIINKGLNDVKLMNLKMVQTDDFEILSATNEEYIGNLDSDDFETAEFRILLKESNTVEIPLELEYRDYNNKLYHKDVKLKLNVYSSKKLGLTNGSNWWVYLIIVIVIAGVFIYKKRKSKNKK